MALQASSSSPSTLYSRATYAPGRIYRSVMWLTGSGFRVLVEPRAVICNRRGLGLRLGCARFIARVFPEAAPIPSGHGTAVSTSDRQDRNQFLPARTVPKRRPTRPGAHSLQALWFRIFFPSKRHRHSPTLIDCFGLSAKMILRNIADLFECGSQHRSKKRDAHRESGPLRQPEAMALPRANADKDGPVELFAHFLFPLRIR